MKKKEEHTYYNYQFKHTAVSVTQHPYTDSKIMKNPIFISGWALFIVGFIANSFVSEEINSKSSIGYRIAPLGFAVSIIGFLFHQNL